MPTPQNASQAEQYSAFLNEEYDAHLDEDWYTAVYQNDQDTLAIVRVLRAARKAALLCVNYLF